MASQNEFRFAEDILLVKELLSLSDAELAAKLGVSVQSVGLWTNGKVHASSANVVGFYDFAFRSGIRINRIKEQLYFEEEGAEKKRTVLFHGAKTGIEGPLQVSRSRIDNDFGQGFYCGEALRQPVMYVVPYEGSSLYVLAFDDPGNLRCEEYAVDRDWMLTIAYFRKRIGEFEDSPLLASIVKRALAADLVVAPIADNRMYQVIDEFLDGEITDVQCQHCLSATNLGRQYVFRTQRALEQVEILERCYLCPLEKADYLESRREETRVGIDKAKAARRAYRGQGLYIDQLLGGGADA